MHICVGQPSYDFCRWVLCVRAISAEPFAFGADDITAAGACTLTLEPVTLPFSPGYYPAAQHCCIRAVVAFAWDHAV